MGCQRENDRKSYHFLFGTFFDRGVHFEKQRRYEENKHYGCVQSSRTVGIASCKLQLIIFIMFKVQVQLSRKHKYHNYSTKNRGCSRDTSYLSNSGASHICCTPAHHQAPLQVRFRELRLPSP